MKSTRYMCFLCALFLGNAGCASIQEEHSEKDVLIQALARRPLSKDVVHALETEYVGSFNTHDAALVIKGTSQTICRNEIYDVYEEQRHTVRRIKDPVVPLSVSVLGMLSAGCASLHMAHQGCLSGGENEDGTPNEPFTPAQDRAAAIGFGLFSVGAFALVGVDLMRARDRVEVLDRREEVHPEERVICHTGPMAHADLELAFSDDSGLSTMHITTNEDGIARFELSNLLVLQEALPESSSPGLIQVSENQTVKLPPLPQKWQRARRKHFDDELWNRAVSSGHIDDYFGYLQSYASGMHARQAHAFLYPALMEKGSTTQILQYLDTHKTMPGEQRRTLHSRYAQLVNEAFIKDYPKLWDDDDALRARWDKLPPESIEEISRHVYQWHAEQLKEIDPADYEARWSHALALWKQRKPLAHEQVQKTEMLLAKLSSDNFMAVHKNKTVQPLTPLMQRIKTLHAQVVSSEAKGQIARVLSLHHYSEAVDHFELKHIDEAQSQLDDARTYAREVNEQKLSAELDRMQLKISNVKANALLAKLTPEMSYTEQTDLLRQILALEPEPELATQARLAVLDTIKPLLSEQLSRGDDLMALKLLISSDSKVDARYQSVMIDVLIDQAKHQAEHDIAGDVYVWRNTLQEAEELATTKKEQRKVSKASAALQKKLEAAYPIDEFDSWNNRYEFMALYPFTHTASEFEDVLSRPWKHKGARIAVGGYVKQNVGGKYLMKTDSGHLLFLESKTDRARRALKSGRRIAMYVVIRGTIPYKKGGKTIKVARADAIAGVRW